MKCKACVLVLCLLLLLVAPGCSRVNQLNERLIVNGIGVDIEDGAYVVTTHVFDAEKASAGGEQSQDVVVATGRGRSVLDAFHSIILQSGKEPLYSQNLILIVGEEAAQKGLNNIIDFFIRYYESRSSVALFVAKGMSAREIMNCRYEGDLITAKAIENLALSGQIATEESRSNILSLVNRMQDRSSDGYMIALDMYEDSDENCILYADGIGVLKDDKLAGYLTFEETIGFLLMTGDAENAIIVVPIEGVGNVSFSITKADSTIEAKVENDLPVYDISIHADLNLYEIDGNLHQRYSLEVIDVMEKAAEKAISDLCTQTAEKVIGEYQSDIFRFGRRLMQAQPEYFKTKSDDWGSTFVQSTVRLSVEADVQREGQEINPL